MSWEHFVGEFPTTEHEAQDLHDMSLVGFTFGSFGDLCTIMQLVWRVRAALNEATGASAEIRARIAEINSFSYVKGARA
ncbi:hypothetical protein AURDEDRAFT_172904 [Auricularia subglabra TFB-10046 SS5]|nr:hypothetical protein AURDEDRAFT_172904 [Auricularia subglabra TFB-10046 SS5]